MNYRKEPPMDWDVLRVRRTGHHSFFAAYYGHHTSASCPLRAALCIVRTAMRSGINMKSHTKEEMAPRYIETLPRQESAKYRDVIRHRYFTTIAEEFVEQTADIWDKDQDRP